MPVSHYILNTEYRQLKHMFFRQPFMKVPDMVKTGEKCTFSPSHTGQHVLWNDFSKLFHFSTRFNGLPC